MIRLAAQTLSEGRRHEETAATRGYAVSADAPVRASGPAPVVIDINDHVVGFYAGRGLTAASPVAGIEGNWVDRAAWDLGTANYAVYAGGRALVYGTTPLPGLGQWERDYLAETKGITHFTVALSHWQLDHIAGIPSYADSTIVSLELTRDYLVEHREAIEAGTLWGPPALDVVLPNMTFTDGLVVYLGDLAVEFHNFNIHSRDGNVMHIPSDRTLYVGDALEDTVTLVLDPGDIPSHIAELDRLRALDIETIYPNHGDPDAIKGGGYTKAFIDATREYDVNLLQRVHEPGYLAMPLEDFIPDALANRTVSVLERYRVVHANNLELVHGYWKDTPIPAVP